MSFSKSRAGVGVVILAIMLWATSRGNAADFDAVALELPTQAAASVADFNLNLPVAGSAALHYLDQESFEEVPGGAVYQADSSAAVVSWEILWQQPALIQVSAVPEPSVGTTMLLGVLLLRRLLRRRERKVGGAACGGK
jgi:hypothetical protein